MEKIEFTFVGLELMEPMSLITNWLMAFFAILYYFKTDRSTQQKSLWKSFFLIMAISTFFGGLSHLFYNYTGMPLKMVSWWINAIALTFLERSIVVIIQKDSLKRFLKFFIPIKAIVLIALSAIFQNFIWIVLAIVIAFMVIMLPAYIRSYKERGEAKFIILGIFVLIFSGVFQVFKISLHQWLTGDDIAHFIVALSLIIFYMGVKRMENTQKLDSEK